MNQEFSFGRIVKEHRRARDLTQAELARRVACATITIRKIEADALRPSQQIAERLAMALAIPLEDRAAFVRLARTSSPRTPTPSTLPTPPVLSEEIGDKDLTGRAIRGYDLGERIGAGGFGVVYLAVQPLIDREVAIKIILPHYANHPDFIRRFEAEAHLVARLEHPYIVPLYDYWREPEVAYLAMRFLRGGNLQDKLKAGPLPLETISQLLEQIGAALHVAHRAGVIHRDIKPANVLLDEDNNGYLADFGIAKNFNMDDQTQAGEVVGSPAYLSPEQIKAESIGPQTDIYCLGIMLYELLTGQKPFQGPTPIAYIQQHLDTPLPSLAERHDELPASLDPVIRRATAKDPGDRYPDVLSLLDGFRQAVALSTTTAQLFTARQNGADVENPFKGLRPFGDADVADFFGRDTLVQTLLGRLAESGDLSRFLAIVGPSGSGKSSVVKAGLVPALRQGGLPDSQNWFIVEMMPGTHPLEELEAALLRVAVNPPESLLVQLQEDERGLLRAVRRILPNDSTTELLLVIDQFEEIFTLCDDESTRAHLLDSLVTAILDPRSRLRVIITLRADFTDRPLQYVDFGELVRQRTEFVLPLTPDELEEVILKPAERVELTVEPGLADTIISDLGDQPGTLPLLQYTLTELFERRVGNVLTLGAYQTTGGVRGALASSADELYTGLDDEGQKAARQLFLRLITLGEFTGEGLAAPDTRRRALRSELTSLTTDGRPQIANSDNGNPSAAGSQSASIINSVIDQYGRHRLLTFDRDPITRGPTVEVAHEALIREWERLRAWLGEDREFLLWQQRLRAALHQWETSEQDEGALLRGAALAEAENWFTQRRVDLSEAEQAYIQAGLNLRQREAEEREAQQQRELETAQKLAEAEHLRAEEQAQAAGKLRQRAIILGIALLVAAILAVFAVVFGQQAVQNEQQAIAEAEQRATAQANAEAETILRATAQANAEAQQVIAETQAMQRATAQAIAEQEREIAQQQREEAQSQANLATSRELSLAALNNLESDPELSMLLALQALDTSYTKEAEEALHQGMQTSRALMTLSGHTGKVYSSIFSPDGSHIATLSNDGTVKMWEGVSGRLLHTMPYQGIDILHNTLMFEESGSKVALVTVGDDSKSVILNVWDVESGEILSQKELPIPPENWSVALSPDWKWIVAGRENGIAEFWDVEGTEKVFNFSGHDDIVEGVSFSSDSSRLATSSRNGQVIVWDIEESLASVKGQAITSFETPNDHELIKVYFSNDGTRLALSFLDNAAEVWDLDDTNQPQFTLAGHTNWIQYATFDASDTWLTTSAADGTAKVWDLTTGEERFTLSGHKGFVYRSSFSPDGHRFVTSSQDGTARIWDMRPHTDGEILGVATGSDGFDLKLSPDEQSFAVGSSSGPATLWNANTGKQLLTLRGEPDTAVYRAAFKPDGFHLATVGEDGIVRIWDTETGDLFMRFVGHTGGNAGGRAGTLDVAYSPDGLQLATAGADGVAKVWDAETGEELFVLAGHTAGLHSLAYSPDSRFIATSSDSGDTTVKVWDAQSGEEVYTLGPNPGRAWGLAFSPDGKRLATAGAGGYLKVWDMVTGEELITMTGQASTIGTVAFTPDGQLITGGVESASIWDVASGTELVNLVPKNSWKIALTQDGRRLFAANFLTHTVGVYAVPLEDAVELAQSQLTRPLTEDECRQFLHVDACPEG